MDRLYKKAAKKYHELYKNKVYRKKADNWLRTIKQFQIIQKTYPDHPRAPQSLYNIGKLYRSLYKLNHRSIYFDRSNIFFRKLVDEYPESSLADNAQFLLAENYEIFKGDKDLAYLEYKVLVDHFPDGNTAVEARKKMAGLRPPQKDLKIAQARHKAMAPVVLTTARFGGLSQEDDDQERALVQVSRVDYWSTVDWSRMVVNTKQEVRYKYQVLKKDRQHRQERMVIDILHSYYEKNKRNIASKDGLITQARIAQFDKQTVRIVLDMASLEKIKVFHFKLPNQYKIVIDILGKVAVAETKSSVSRRRVSKRNNKQSNNSVYLSKALGLKVKRIILDPGHGGKDPGASAFGVKEKDVALNIALALKRIIRQNHSGLEVLLTRTTNKYITLEARTAFANKNRGDLFVSIHVNASPRPRIRGVETYYLNLTKDNEALSLAAKENQTSLKSISDLQSILNDLLTNSKIQDSSELAEKVQTSVVSMTQHSQHKMRDLGVKKAPFIVLLGAEMPSILIEAGFLTHRAECDALKTVKYRRIIAEGIYRGIKDYMK
ncbi:MAG: AMIN domain-containing protein [Proteobacteria bacterium]|nr:AMIN domain-containing protein [Pseudomonadota bacterium]